MVEAYTEANVDFILDLANRAPFKRDGVKPARLSVSHKTSDTSFRSVYVTHILEGKGLGLTDELSLFFSFFL